MRVLLRRALLTFASLIGVATLSFFLIHLIPGDPVDLMLGDQASTGDRQALRASLGLDQPLTEQYVQFLKRLSHFDLGVSLHGNEQVSNLVSARLPATIELSLAAMLIAIGFGIPLGVLAAVKKNKLTDRVLSTLSLAGASAPSFWIGPILVEIFALKFDLLPISERGGLDHLILPAVTLSIGLASVLLQMTRSSMLEVLNEDFVRTARAKGAGITRVYFKHALANALIPIITVIGLQFGAVLTGVVLVETIFDWPGLGTLLYQSIQQRNYPVVQGCVLTIAAIYVLVNFLTDLAYAAAHPKVRMH